MRRPGGTGSAWIARFSHDPGFLERRAQAVGLTVAESMAGTVRYETEQTSAGSVHCSDQCLTYGSA